MANLPIHTQFTSIQALREALHSGQVSATEIARSALDAVDANSGLNAFLHVDHSDLLSMGRSGSHQGRQRKDGGQ